MPIIVGCILVVLVGQPIIRIIEKFPLGKKIGAFASTFKDGLAGLFTRPIFALSLVALSVVIWSVTIAAVSMALAAFSIPNGFDISLTTWSITLTGMTVVPTPGFFGVYELCCSEALALFGIEETLSKTFAVVLHLGQLIFIGVLGAFFIFREGLKLKDLARQAQ